mmetsp:Transcript_4783/g.19114  ORF Transcript_4783/g.19114 Transcript_4783/m.19114 type:complete len:294 (-) Transcript_4783:1477-2358(-)
MASASLSSFLAAPPRWRFFSGAIAAAAAAAAASAASAAARAFFAACHFASLSFPAVSHTASYVARRACTSSCLILACSAATLVATASAASLAIFELAASSAASDAAPAALAASFAASLAVSAVRAACSAAAAASSIAAPTTWSMSAWKTSSSEYAPAASFARTWLRPPGPSTPAPGASIRLAETGVATTASSAAKQRQPGLPTSGDEAAYAASAFSAASMAAAVAASRGRREVGLFLPASTLPPRVDLSPLEERSRRAVTLGDPVGWAFLGFNSRGFPGPGCPSSHLVTSRSR